MPSLLWAVEQIADGAIARTLLGARVEDALSQATAALIARAHVLPLDLSAHEAESRIFVAAVAHDVRANTHRTATGPLGDYVRGRVEVRLRLLRA